MAIGETYDEFIDKFKPKKTTDDCYTPEPIYEVIKDWAVNEYDLHGREIIRPFWNGADYEKDERLQKGALVIDNPPFSILSAILTDFLEWGVDFFLFAPFLTATSYASPKFKNTCVVLTGSPITYENGAKVPTAFLTNMDQYKLRTEPALAKTIEAVNERIKGEDKKQVANHDYPSNVISSARMRRAITNGVEIKIKPDECYFTRALDNQKKHKKTIYGSGLLISDEKAQEFEQKFKDAQMEREAENPFVWELSERERKIIAGLGK